MSSENFGNPQAGPSISRDANPQLLVFRQIDRKATAATMGDEMSWKSGINELIAQLPESSKKAIKEQESDYVIIHDEWVSRRSASGRVLQGDVHNPLIINRRGDIDYDADFVGRMYEVKFDPETGETLEVAETWQRGGPHWWSPEWKHWEETDYSKLNEIVHNEMERVNLTWKHDKRDIVVANPDYKPKPRKKPPPTPMF